MTDSRPGIDTSGQVFSKTDADLLGRAVQQINSGTEKPKYFIQTGDRSFSNEIPVLKTEEDRVVVRLTREDGGRDFGDVWGVYDSLKKELEESK